MNYTFQGRVPYDHQIETFKALVRSKAWLVASEPGTGKTRSLVCAADALFKAGRSKRALYICPDSVRETIGREIASWTDLSCTVLGGSSQVRAYKLKNTDTYFYVINYDSCPLLKKELAAKDFDLLICDESTRLKSLKSQRHKAVKHLAQTGKVTWLATGTPMPRDPLDLHGQFTVMDPSIFGSSDDFKREYVEYKFEPGCMPVIIGYKNQEKLREIVLKHSTRFLKKDCLDLPEKIHVNLDVPMSAAQSKIYTQFRKELMAELPSGAVMPIRSAMAKFIRFHQVTTGFVGSETGGILEWIESPKLDALIDLLDTLQLHENKVIIWCSYTPSIHRIQEKLAHLNPAMFYGGVANKDPEIQKFLHDPSCRVMIGNSKVGIGCTLNVAKYTVYFELPYFDNEALVQSQDRNHRIGQTEKVTYYYLLTPSSIDITISRKLADRTALAEYLTGGELGQILDGA